jgi:hypothetical protein
MSLSLDLKAFAEKANANAGAVIKKVAIDLLGAVVACTDPSATQINTQTRPYPPISGFLKSSEPLRPDMDSDTPVKAVQAKASPFSLTVKFAFADYQVGQIITDPDEVAAVLAGECAGNVLKVATA